MISKALVFTSFAQYCSIKVVGTYVSISDHNSGAWGIGKWLIEKVTSTDYCTFCWRIVWRSLASYKLGNNINAMYLS